MSEVQNEVYSQQVASSEEVEYLIHELTQSQIERASYQTLHNTSRSGASEISSEIQQVVS